MISSKWLVFFLCVNKAFILVADILMFFFFFFSDILWVCIMFKSTQGSAAKAISLLSHKAM